MRFVLAVLAWLASIAGLWLLEPVYADPSTAPLQLVLLAVLDAVAAILLAPMIAAHTLRSPVCLATVPLAPLAAAVEPRILPMLALPLGSATLWLLSHVKLENPRRLAAVSVSALASLSIVLGIHDTPVAAIPATASIPLLFYLSGTVSSTVLLVALSYSAVASTTLWLLNLPWATLQPAMVSLATGFVLARRAASDIKARREILGRPPSELYPFITSYLVMTAIFIVVAFAGLILAGSYPGEPIGFTGAFVFSYGLVGTGYYIYKLLFIRPELRFKPLKSRWYTAWFMERAWAYRLLESYVERLRRLMERAAHPENPIIYAARYMMLSIILLAAAPAASALAVIDTAGAAIAVLLVVALAGIVLSSPFIAMRGKLAERRRNVDDELPWLTLLAATLQPAGIPLYESMRRLIGRGLLPEMEREARFVEKSIMVMGRDWITALEEVARNHPSMTFKDFVLGYTSILRTGGDVTGYLESRLREMLEWLSFRLRQYAAAAMGIGEILTILFTVFVSIFALAGGFIENTAMLQAVAYLGIPPIFTVMYSMINAIQPRTLKTYKITVGHLIPAIGILLATVYIHVHGAGMGWYSLALVMLVLGLTYGIQYHFKMRVARRHEEALEDFLRDVTEMRKIGLPPARAILALAKSRGYNTEFDKVLARLASQLRLNVPLVEAVMRTQSPSWLVNMTLFILGEIEATGGGTVKTLEQLTQFISSYNMALREMRSRLRAYELLAIITPILLGGLVSMSAGMARVFAEQNKVLAASARSAGIGVTTIFNVTPESVEVARLLAVEASLAFAALAAKTSEFSLKATLRIALVAAIVISMNLYIDPILQDVVSSMFSTAP